MKITFKEVLSRKQWLHTELLNSLTFDLINQAAKDQFYEVKLLVNGVEIEPLLFNKIMDNIESYISKQAKSLVLEQFEEVENKFRNLSELAQRTAEKIKEDYNLYDYDDE